MVVNACMKLHNLGVDNDHYMIATLDRGFRIHDDLMPIKQHVASMKPKYLNNKVDSTLRDGICDAINTQGHARPIANRKNESAMLIVLPSLGSARQLEQVVKDTFPLLLRKVYRVQHPKQNVRAPIGIGTFCLLR